MKSSRVGVCALAVSSASAYLNPLFGKQQIRSTQDVCRQDVLSSVGLITVGTAASFFVRPQEAHAEYSLANRKVAYRRYVPRILAGRDFLSGQFKNLIDNKQWKEVADTFVKEDQARSDSESRQRFNSQRVIDRWEKELFSPMRVYSQSFSEKGTSPRLAELLKAEGLLEGALRRLELVAKGDLSPPQGNPTLPFGFGVPDNGPDPLAGKSQADMANALYADAKKAFNDWVEIVNRSIGLQLNPLGPIA